MPNRNGTGPLRKGPLTGWGKGRCRKNSNLKKLDNDKSENGSTIYGVGKGGLSPGGGKGKCWKGRKNTNNNTNK